MGIPLFFARIFLSQLVGKPKFTLATGPFYTRVVFPSWTCLDSAALLPTIYAAAQVDKEFRGEKSLKEQSLVCVVTVLIHPSLQGSSVVN